MLNHKFMGREPIQRAKCPFCSLPVEKPKELKTRKPGEMPVGLCSCGAAYACDETGHNLGGAQIEALLFSCNMDWDLAWDLVADEDFKQEIVENYDLNTHLVIPSGTYEGRKINGALLFIRVDKEVREVTEEGARKRLKEAVVKKPARKTSPAERLSKKQIEEKVKAYDVNAILEAVSGDHKILRYLQRLLYSGDSLFRHRAAEILGRACAIMGDEDPGIVSKLLQGLFYSLTDTAAFPLGAFEAIGEIIRWRPDLYGGYASQLYQYMADPTRKTEALKTLGRISKTKGSFLRKHTFHFFPFLEDPDPSVRGYAAWLMGNLGAFEAKKDLEKLLGESHEIEIYEKGQLQKISVGRVAEEALKKI